MNSTILDGKRRHATVPYLLAALVGATLIARPLPALAQDPPDVVIYKQGKVQFNLAAFDKAIDLFKQAYELADKAAYLFNIGFTYEKLNDCRNAQFFFERFLKRADEDKAKPLDAKTRADAETRIAKNAECAKTQPPDPTVDPDPKPDPKPDVAVVPDPDKPEKPEDECITGDEEACGESNLPDDGKPHLIVARVGGGIGLVGAGPLDVPGQFSVALTAGYPLPLGEQMRLELGLGGVFTPVPYTIMGGGGQGSASLMTILANVGFTYDVIPKVGLHGALGIGAQLFNGLKEGNPFTEGGRTTTGALTTLAIRTGLVGEYHFTPMISAFVSPAFTYSPPKDGLREEISALTRIEFLAGVGIRK